MKSTNTVIESNPYRPVKLTTFVRLYRFFSEKKYTNIILVKVSAILLILIRTYGFWKLNNHSVNKSVASYRNDIFEFRSYNSQFHSIYFECYEKGYEKDVITAMSKFLPKGGVFIDIGSNWGHHSLIAAKEFKADVIAFEPNLDVWNDFDSIIKQLNVESNIKVYNCALSDREQQLELVQNYFESGVSSISSEYALKRNNEKYVKKIHEFLNLRPIKNLVECKRADELLKDVDRIDLIKIDAEGAELSILKGAKNTILKTQPKIIFEFHTSSTNEFDGFNEFFKLLDYKILVINEDCSSYEDMLFQDLILGERYNLLALPK